MRPNTSRLEIGNLLIVYVSLNVDDMTRYDMKQCCCLYECSNTALSAASANNLNY